MWSSRLAAVAALVLASAQAGATPTMCPAKQDGQPLSTGYVLDGPLQDKAILEADSGGSKNGVEFARWKVRYVYDAGRQVTLDCRYGDGATPVAVVIATPVKVCSYSKSKKRGVELRCR